mmetsp:Transcript_7162/g.12873  ORF Transcript_7162/g.12873 Transcript_7162/m.12873 type:complete len:299 (+) Transcript_7162:747-1643(+)
MDVEDTHEVVHGHPEGIVSSGALFAGPRDVRVLLPKRGGVSPVPRETSHSPWVGNFDQLEPLFVDLHEVENRVPPTLEDSLAIEQLLLTRHVAFDHVRLVARCAKHAGLQLRLEANPELALRHLLHKFRVLCGVHGDRVASREILKRVLDVSVRLADVLVTPVDLGVGLLHHHRPYFILVSALAEQGLVQLVEGELVVDDCIDPRPLLEKPDAVPPVALLTCVNEKILDVAHVAGDHGERRQKPLVRDRTGSDAVLEGAVREQHGLVRAEVGWAEKFDRGGGGHAGRRLIDFSVARGG